MELVIGFVIAVAAVLLLAEEGWLGQDNERVWVNHLADRSRKQAMAGRGARRRQKYAAAGLCKLPANGRQRSWRMTV